MNESEQRRIAEALILASPDPVPAARLASVIPRCTPARARALVDALNAEYAEQERAFEICEVAGGYQVRTLAEHASYLQRLQPARPLRLSQAALETLAIAAHRQPVTRAEVEYVRGVDAGAVLRSLLERKLLRIAGHREVAGRPLLYATTRRFLEVFGLARLEDLPTLRDIEEIAPSEPKPGSEADGEAAAPALAEAPFLADLEPNGEPH
jgi:segregation and condensation protein B